MRPYELYCQSEFQKQAFLGAFAGIAARGAGMAMRGIGSVATRMRSAVAKIPAPPPPKPPAPPVVKPVTAKQPAAKPSMGNMMDHLNTASTVASLIPRGGGGSSKPSYDPNSMLGDRQGQIGY